MCVLLHVCTHTHRAAHTLAHTLIYIHALTHTYTHTHTYLYSQTLRLTPQHASLPVGLCLGSGPAVKAVTLSSPLWPSKLHIHRLPWQPHSSCPDFSLGPCHGCVTPPETAAMRLIPLDPRTSQGRACLSQAFPLGSERPSTSKGPLSVPATGLSAAFLPGWNPSLFAEHGFLRSEKDQHPLDQENEFDKFTVASFISFAFKVLSYRILFYFLPSDIVLVLYLGKLKLIDPK